MTPVLRALDGSVRAAKRGDAGPAHQWLAKLRAEGYEIGRILPQREKLDGNYREEFDTTTEYSAWHGIPSRADYWRVIAIEDGGEADPGPDVTVAFCVPEEKD